MTEINGQAASQESLDLLLEEAALNGSARLERYPERKFFGYFCSYFPEELLLAAGLEPLRLFPDSGNATPAELPAYCCTLAKGTLDLEVRGRWLDLAGVGFTHTCDTMQCLSGIWAAAGLSKTVDLVPPVMLKAPGASRYYLAELSSLLVKLSTLTQQAIKKEALQDAIMLCAQTRNLATELDVLRPNLPSSLVSAILRAGQVMPRSVYNQALENCFPTLQEMAAPPQRRVKVLISGAILENDHLVTMIEDLGGRVVADDTCTGYRHFSGLTVTGAENPLSDLVQRYSAMPPCPCKNQGLEERLTHLNDLAQQRQAQCAIIVLRKYCEPHAWDAVALAESFQNSGIRCLNLELEGADVGGQERTRLQAFLESMLEDPGL